MDTTNPVVRLCAEGMHAEAERRPEVALGFFQQAWESRSDDYDAAVAAHFLARQQADPDQMLHWNEIALQHARAVEDQALVRGFYPSLHLNLGFSLESVGRVAEAADHYRQAAAKLDAVPEGPYGDVLRGGIGRALDRVRGGRDQAATGAESADVE